MTASLSPETLDLLALTLVPGMGPRLTAALMARFGTAAAIRRATPDELRSVPHIGEKLSQQFAAALRSIGLQVELELLEKYRVEVLSRWDNYYPRSLAGIEDPPPLLYFRGTLTDHDSQSVAIVGSRHCTTYGRRMAERIAGGLARAGVTVVSGLARGIDGAAHLGALKAGGRTIAVLAGGLSRIYPPEHADMAAEIEKTGCLLSETPMTFEPLPGMFPARNRIISGLSRAVVIVEAGEKSGALITAEHAGEQGRELFSVPGNADSPASAGTLRLLREGARLVRDADDILEDLAGIAPIASPAGAAAPEASIEPEARPSGPPPGLDDMQVQIWEQLREGPKHVDELVRILGVPVAQINGMLMVMEMKRAVRRLPGNIYERRT